MLESSTYMIKLRKQQVSANIRHNKVQTYCKHKQKVLEL